MKNWQIILCLFAVTCISRIRMFQLQHKEHAVPFLKWHQHFGRCKISPPIISVISALQLSPIAQQQARHNWASSLRTAEIHRRTRGGTAVFFSRGAVLRLKRLTGVRVWWLWILDDSGGNCRKAQKAQISPNIFTPMASQGQKCVNCPSISPQNPSVHLSGWNGSCAEISNLLFSSENLWKTNAKNFFSLKSQATLIQVPLLQYVAVTRPNSKQHIYIYSYIFHHCVKHGIFWAYRKLGGILVDAKRHNTNLAWSNQQCSASGHLDSSRFIYL